jgi:hypothetical protein
VNRVCLVLVTFLVAACGGSGARPETLVPVGSVEGAYEYLANLPGQQVRGTLQFIGDTVLVSPAAEYCRPESAHDPVYIHYSCPGSGSVEGILLRIARRNPLQLSRWSAGLRVQRQRQVCRRYEMRAGRQVCAETGTETYETTESRGGTLLVQRVP